MTSSTHYSSRRSFVFFSKITHNVFHPASKPTHPASMPSYKHNQSSPVGESPLLLLPLEIREQIYGHLVGMHEVLHILQKHHRSSLPLTIAYRRCREGGKVENCLSGKCRELQLPNGLYAGKFDGGSTGLLRTCRQIYYELSTVLYAENTFDFDHPVSFLMFTSTINPSFLNSIRSLTFDLPTNLYVSSNMENRRHIRLVLDDGGLRRQWQDIWDKVAEMKGLERVRVRFLDDSHVSLHPGTKDSGEAKLLEALGGIKRKLQHFEVEGPWAAGESNTESELAAEEFPFTLIRASRRGDGYGLLRPGVG